MRIGTAAVSALKITVIPVLSINLKGTSDNTEVYPNPTNEAITIHFDPSLRGEKRVELSDNQGNMLIKKTVSEATLHLGLKDFPAGTYLLKIQQADNVVTKKVVKL